MDKNIKPYSVGARFEKRVENKKVADGKARLCIFGTAAMKKCSLSRTLRKLHFRKA